uniref:Type I cytokine receptor cytokine-binding domain-containing protein n=1 Tax=Neogobius melanostomus TaxID=47308 RepID=A0A8C6T3B7_9GOBI
VLFVCFILEVFRFPYTLDALLLFAVDPPQDLAITDLGHLGNLEIHWNASQEHIRSKEHGQCSVKYELHYYDSYSSSWTVSVQSLIHMMIYSLFCKCHVLLVRVSGHPRLHSGHSVDGIQNLTCVYYNMEHMVCRWKRSSKMPVQSQVALHYWSVELAHAKECPHYVISEGFRSGCNFSGTELPTFSDINLCVNASAARPVRALYSSLQIQNIVKPKAIGEVHVEAGADGQLRVLWDSPTGRIPQHCLQWEVQEMRESQDGKQTLVPFHVLKSSQWKKM